jgi:hypothetical protein
LENFEFTTFSSELFYFYNVDNGADTKQRRGLSVTVTMCLHRCRDETKNRQISTKQIDRINV